MSTKSTPAKRLPQPRVEQRFIDHALRQAEQARRDGNMRLAAASQRLADLQAARLVEQTREDEQRAAERAAR